MDSAWRVCETDKSHTTLFSLHFYSGESSVSISRDLSVFFSHTLYPEAKRLQFVCLYICIPYSSHFLVYCYGKQKASPANTDRDTIQTNNRSAAAHKSASRKNPGHSSCGCHKTVIFSTPQDSAAQESEWTYGNLNKKRSSSVSQGAGAQ